MLLHPIRRSARALSLMLLLIAPPALAADSTAMPPAVANAMAGASPQAIAAYRRKLAEYQEARAAFEVVAGPYWSAVTEKRRGRNAKRRAGQLITLDDYVLTQPPLYSGPAKPVDPAPPEQPPRERKTMPVVADLLQAAAEHFQFVPQRPAGELEFKRAYARVALAS